MDELKELIGLVADLPHAALWVIAAIFGYKVIVVGSIYGVVRFVVEKTHDWLVAKKAREVEYKEIRPMLDGMCIGGQTDRLIAQITRLRGVGVSIKSNYIHGDSVDWLREAIDQKMERDAEKASAV